jgi:hypothetical protein
MATSTFIEPDKRNASGRESRRLARVNSALRQIWRMRIAERPALCASVIVGKARAAAGTAGGSPAFSDGWEERLELLTSELDTHAGLTPLGRTIAHGQLVAAATNMLRVMQLWERHPEIHEVAIERPLVIIGQMRSGTTRIQRLLACDDNFHCTRFYESWVPLRSQACSKLIDDRPWRARAALAAARLLNPDFHRLHPTHASAPDEEIGLFNLLMMPAAFEVQWRIPLFARHCEALDTVPIYRLIRRLLQTFAWQRGGAAARPWIMKVPQYAQDLASLLTVFPDARIVRTTRPQDAILASTVKLVANQMSVQSEKVDFAWIEGEWRRKIALREARIAAALARSKRPVSVVDFEAVEANWLKAVTGLYQRFGMPLSAATIARMQAFQDRQANNRPRAEA